MKYAVVLEKSPNAWGAYPPDLPGVGVVGSTPEDALELVDGAISLMIEELHAVGGEIPQPTSRANEVLSGFAFVSGIVETIDSSDIVVTFADR